MKVRSGPNWASIGLAQEGKMIARVEAIEADIPEVDARIEAHLAPFAPAVARLLEIPGIGPAAAATIIAEIGVDMTRFPTPAHLAGWAKFAPGVKESAGRRKGNGSTGHGNRYLAGSWARSPSLPPGPTRSSANATGASPEDAAPNARSSRSAAPC